MLRVPDLAKPEGRELILKIFQKKGYKKDALDKRLRANRWYEAFSRRPGQTMQDFFATENMAYADAVKAGVAAADSSMVRCKSDHPDEFIAFWDDPNEEITEQWQGGLHGWYTGRSDPCSVKSDRVSSVVSQRRRSSNFCSCLKRCSVSKRSDIDATSM